MVDHELFIDSHVPPFVPPSKATEPVGSTPKSADSWPSRPRERETPKTERSPATQGIPFRRAGRIRTGDLLTPSHLHRIPTGPGSSPFVAPAWGIAEPSSRSIPARPDKFSGIRGQNVVRRIRSRHLCTPRGSRAYPHTGSGSLVSVPLWLVLGVSPAPTTPPTTPSIPSSGPNATTPPNATNTVLEPRDLRRSGSASDPRRDG
ncbi:MAG: hypothetical protein BMS9Abin17_1319 [Acidimicrobiia bacterium]|nr:MAG: hypothetical protein BMS9Abin17_1319 [Acidimicrobiia bacterium]